MINITSRFYIDLHHGDADCSDLKMALTHLQIQESASIMARTIPQAFWERVSATPDAPAYLQYQDGAWQSLSWREVGKRVARRAAIFARSELTAGDRVGLFLPNSVDWVVSDIAALSQGLTTVPVYTRDSATNICHVMRDSGAKCLVTDTAERWKSLGKERQNLPELAFVLSLNGDQDTDERIVACEEPSDETDVPLSDGSNDPDGLATVIYTSGTTGPPKGVMLSHRAFLWNASAVNEVNALTTDDLLLSILPLAHAFEHTLGYLNPMLANAPVAYGRSVEHLAEDMLTLRPTVMLAVPRLFDRVRARIEEKANSSAISRTLLKWSVNVGWERSVEQGGNADKQSAIRRLFWYFIGRRLASRVQDAFGGRMRMMICGGAPLSADTSRFMAAMELPLLQGYGLTEAGPAATGSKIEERRTKSVGFALPGCELKIGERGELLLRSPGVMMGYWNNAAATADVLDKDGWLHTGDVAEIIDGRVYIKGRLKDILVLSTGENVNPNPIEASILADGIIDQACVLGDEKPWCCAVVVVNQQTFAAWATKNGLNAADPKDKKLCEALKNHLVARMNDIPPFARIGGVVIEQKPWELDSGLITPTLKAKRPRVAERYAQEIEQLY